MLNNATIKALIDKLWNNFWSGGISNPLTAIEQITYLIFMKRLDDIESKKERDAEFTGEKYVSKFSGTYKAPGAEKPIAKSALRWKEFKHMPAEDMLMHVQTKVFPFLKELEGGDAFAKSMSNAVFIMPKPSLLVEAIKTIDLIFVEIEVDANTGGQSFQDIQGDVYEMLLSEIASAGKNGQFRTPRHIIKLMADLVKPQIGQRIADPACGTGGFFLAAYDWIVDNQDLDKEAKKFLKYETFFGNEIVASTRRLALMNLFLHNIGDIDSDNFISPNDSLITDSGTRYDYILANPPFGKKSSMTFTNEEGEQEKEDLTYNRTDFWVTTSNKQLNFVQHIRTMLKTTGKAAVVLPDNVLFEGGVGETVRKKLLETTDLHTILRLPTGIFYANGVKANVLFFDGKPSSKNVQTKDIWVYDYRTNVHHTLKKNPLKLDDLKDFIKLYNPSNPKRRKETYNAETNPEGRWRKFTYDDIIARDKTSLDITWLKDKSLADLDNLPDPDVLALDIVENLEAGLESFRTIIASLNKK